MSTFAENVMDDLKIAMKAKDSVALTTLRALKTALTNAAIESGNKDNVIAQVDALAIVRKQIKQRNDSIEQFENAGRSELAEKEKAEIVVLEKYLPAAMSPEEVSAIVAAAVSETGASSRAEMGKVMGIVQGKTAGRVDGKTLSQEVMKHLS
ncbi:MAG: glutamyl-tRNA amidotransferase [Verrucomicrobiales bacterium]|nr:glutamyl-tRNA amidotransferase [Verrucomicrobiales bacterium]|tara:strand:+ start:12309 stop:12764 length:456 start_codon:yes stop_codon:yes gene_type:complete